MTKALPTTKLLEDYESKKILIVGATGYIGTKIVEELKTVACEIIALGRRELKLGEENQVAKIVGHRADIRSQGIWESFLEGIDYVFYLAAQTSVMESNADPLEDYKLNVLPFIQLLECLSKKASKAKVIFSGTVTEVGVPNYLPVDEIHPDRPITVYDYHKLTAENKLVEFCGRGIITGCTLRLANVYGPGAAVSATDRGVLGQMINRALRGCNLKIYGDGHNIRDFIYIDDVVRAFLCAAPLAKQISGKKFVVASGVGVTIQEAFEAIASLVSDMYGISVRLERIDHPSGPQAVIDQRDFIGDITAFSKATQWQPLMAFREGLEKTIRHFASRLSQN